MSFLRKHYRSSHSSSESRSRSPHQGRQRNELPRVLTDLFGEDQCKLCGVEMTSSIIAKMHYGGKPHYKRVKKFMTEWCAQRRLPMIELEEPLNVETDNDMNNYCEYCDVHFTSLNDKLIHVSGKKHKKNEEDPTNAKKKKKGYVTVDLTSKPYVVPLIAGSTSQSYTCEICDMKLVSYDQLQIHMAGKKHHEKLEKMSSIGSSSGGKFYCKICQLELGYKRQLEMHLSGRPHAKAVFQKRKGDKEEKKDCQLTCNSCPFVGNLDEHCCDESLKNLQVGEAEFACSPCGMVFDSEAEAEDHQNTRRHLITTLNKDKGDKIIKDLHTLYCFTCKVQTKNYKEYTEHLFSQIHLEKYSIISNLENKHIFFCQVCDLYMDSAAKEGHERDRIHVKKSVVLEVQSHLTEWARHQNTPREFHCDDCGGLFSDFLSYSRHMLSNSHVDRQIQHVMDNL